MHATPSVATPAIAGASGGGAAAPAAAAAPTAAGGGGQAAEGLEALVPALSALAQALQGLADVLKGMASGGQSAVNGRMGQAATTDQYVGTLAGSVLAGGEEDHDFEQRVLELVNEERASRGLGTLSYNPVLDKSAEDHASHMAKVGRMAHDGIGDGTPGERIRAEGFRDSWGENVATGQRTPEQVVKEWMASPTHRENILNPEFRQLGVAYTTADDGRTYWGQSFGA